MTAPTPIRELVPGGVRLSDDRGVLTLTRPAPHVELIRAEGHARTHFVDAILEQRRAIVAECGTISIFDDLERVAGYDSGVRARLTDWSRENRDKIASFHILTGSRLVAMGVTLANLALGGHIVAHTKRGPFEEALRRALGSESGRPRR